MELFLKSTDQQLPLTFGERNILVSAIEPDRSHLENSRPLSWSRSSSASRWPDAVEHMMALMEGSESRLRARRDSDRKRLEATLGSLLLALYGAYRVDPNEWLGYSRSKSDYRGKNRYEHPNTSPTTVVCSADFLIEQDFVDHRKGSYNRKANPFGGPDLSWGYVSRIRATPKLVELLESQFGLTPDSLMRADWFELVRLKSAPEKPGGSKKLNDYRDTSETRKMREELQALNAHIATFQLDLEPLDKEVGEEVDDVKTEDDENADERPDPRDHSATQLYRVFNNDCFDNGGRFYGGWWQALRKRDRPRLLIDGEETVELDFRALHPRLCYHLQGQPLPPEADPYTLEGLEGGELRDLAKKAFNQLLNVRSGKNPRAPKGATALLPSKLSYKKLVERIEEKHQPIRNWFRSGRGVELQRIDSDIASSILHDFMRHDICCLPVHDSFIVPRSAEFILGQAMCLAYSAQLSRFTGERVYPVISGWSSTEMEAKVMASLSTPTILSFEPSSLGELVGEVAQDHQ